MGKTDFFDQRILREAPRRDSLFGINDAVNEGDNNGMAYTTTVFPDSWNATVVNDSQKAIVFQPLDHNMDVRKGDGNQYSLCDGMLYSSGSYESLIFVELKDRRSNWVKEDVEQLKSTISLFCANHDYGQWKRREAYAANSRHPQFMSSHRTEMQDFHNRTHFFLRIVATITIR